MRYFYARVSTKEQNLDRQLAAAQALGCIDRIYTDKASGKDFEREEYRAMKSAFVPGDSLYILSLDRLGRNYDEIGEEWQSITKMGVGIKVLDMDILDTTEEGDLTKRLISDIVLKLLSYVAQKERESMLIRQRQGLDAMPVVNGKRISTRTGKGFGVDPYEVPGFSEMYERNQRGEITAEEGFKALGIPKSKWYRLAKAVA